MFALTSNLFDVTYFAYGFLARADTHTHTDSHANNTDVRLLSLYVTARAHTHTFSTTHSRKQQLAVYTMSYIDAYPVAFMANCVQQYDRFDEKDLQRLYYQDRLNLENQLDQLFNNRCEAIARGYSWLQKALRTTGRKNFKTAMRRNREFQLKSPDVQREILLEMRYIKSIYENWGLIRENIKETGIDIRGFPLWKLTKCTCIMFCVKESNRPRTRRRNIEREYHPIQIEEILNNVPGSTDRIIEYVNGDEEQLKKIAEDLGAGLLRRSNEILL